MIALASALARGAVRTLLATVRLTVLGAENLDGLRRRKKPFLFVVWHGRILVPIYRHSSEGVVAMVSLSRDGDFAARTLEGLGYKTVRGSSSRGGREAYHAMVAALRAGCCGAVIPDGPRGPARVLKPGVVRLASEAGAALLPLSAAARPALRLRSWDALLLPSPFARAVLLYGEPVEPGPSLTAEAEEAIRVRLEATLTALEDEAERTAADGA